MTIDLESMGVVPPVECAIIMAPSQATVESQLRNAIQTQLDGVDKGLGSLREYVCLSVCLFVCVHVLCFVTIAGLVVDNNLWSTSLK